MFIDCTIHPVGVLAAIHVPSWFTEKQLIGYGPPANREVSSILMMREKLKRSGNTAVPMHRMHSSHFGNVRYYCWKLLSSKSLSLRAICSRRFVRIERKKIVTENRSRTKTLAVKRCSL